MQLVRPRDSEEESFDSDFGGSAVVPTIVRPVSRELSLPRSSRLNGAIRSSPAQATGSLQRVPQRSEHACKRRVDVFPRALAALASTQDYHVGVCPVLALFCLTDDHRLMPFYATSRMSTLDPLRVFVRVPDTTYLHRFSRVGLMLKNRGPCTISCRFSGSDESLPLTPGSRVVSPNTPFRLFHGPSTPQLSPTSDQTEYSFKYEIEGQAYESSFCFFVDLVFGADEEEERDLVWYFPLTASEDSPFRTTTTATTIPSPSVDYDMPPQRGHLVRSDTSSLKLGSVRMRNLASIHRTEFGEARTTKLDWCVDHSNHLSFLFCCLSCCFFLLLLALVISSSILVSQASSSNNLAHPSLRTAFRTHLFEWKETLREKSKEGFANSGYLTRAETRVPDLYGADPLTSSLSFELVDSSSGSSDDELFGRMLRESYFTDVEIEEMSAMYHPFFLRATHRFGSVSFPVAISNEENTNQTTSKQMMMGVAVYFEKEDLSLVTLHRPFYEVPIEVGKKDGGCLSSEPILSGLDEDPMLCESLQRLLSVCYRLTFNDDDEEEPMRITPQQAGCWTQNFEVESFDDNGVAYYGRVVPPETPDSLWPNYAVSVELRAEDDPLVRLDALRRSIEYLVLKEEEEPWNALSIGLFVGAGAALVLCLVAALAFAFTFSLCCCEDSMVALMTSQRYEE